LRIVASEPGSRRRFSSTSGVQSSVLNSSSISRASRSTAAVYSRYSAGPRARVVVDDVDDAVVPFGSGAQQLAIGQQTAQHVLGQLGAIDASE